MLEYILVLLVISAILMVILHRLKNRIPLRPNIIYCSVGISFILGAFFPMAISTLNPGGVVVIYFTLIILSAIALCWVEKKISLGDPQAFEQFVGLDPETAPLYRSEAAFETCATQDYTPAAEPHNGTYAQDSANEPEAEPEPPEPEAEFEAEPEAELEAEPEPAFEEDKPIADEVELDQEPAAAEDMPEKETRSIEDITENIDESPPQDMNDVECNDLESESLSSDEEQPPAPHVEKTEEIKEITEKDSGTDTVNSYVSAGFEAKAKGDLAGAIDLFYKALQLNNDKNFTVAMASEISAVYQDLGQYRQAGMILNSVMKQEKIIKEPALMQDLQSRLTFLKVLVKLLEVAKMPGAPYSKIPNFIKIKANLETAKHIKEFTEGVDEHEK